MSTGESFIAHLVELRTRLLHSVVAVLLAFICLFPWASDLYALLAQPLLAKLPKGGQMIATDVTTPFFVPLKVAMMAAFLIALPYILYQIWRFVAPGLYAHEKRLVIPLIVASTILFFCGMAFAITFQVPVAVVLLVRMGLVTVAKLREVRSYVVVGAFVAGAIFTPPDVVSQFMLAIPLWFLYEAGIVVAVWVGKGKTTKV